MFCKKCGTNNLKVARFCEHCGTKLIKEKYDRAEKPEDVDKNVPMSLVVAVIIVVLLVAAIFAALSWFTN